MLEPNRLHLEILEIAARRLAVWKGPRLHPQKGIKLASSVYLSLMTPSLGSRESRFWVAVRAAETGLGNIQWNHEVNHTLVFFEGKFI